MATNKINLRTVDEFMQDYTPVYRPLYPLLLGNSQQHPSETGEIRFRRVETVGSIRGERITPKDSEIKQVNVMEGRKVFKKYFHAKQYITSEVQDTFGFEDVVSRVLDEHQIQADELILFGDGTSNDDVLNNGLYYSQDSNYLLQDSEEIGNSKPLEELHALVVDAAMEADKVAGEKVVIFYGDTTLKKFFSLYEMSSTAFRKGLEDALEGFSFITMPKAPTPSGAEGFIIVNTNQVKTHYTDLPRLHSRGHNEEKLYYWANFFHGSYMVEVLSKLGVIRQPLTYQA